MYINKIYNTIKFSIFNRNWKYINNKMNIKISKIVQEKPKNLMNDLIKYINQKKTEVHKE